MLYKALALLLVGAITGLLVALIAGVFLWQLSL